MAVTTVPRAEQLELSLLQMHRIRAFEAKAMELFQEKLIRGSVHPYTGMEAIAVGVCSALGRAATTSPRRTAATDTRSRRAST